MAACVIGVIGAATEAKLLSSFDNDVATVTGEQACWSDLSREK